jgi:hypothetical protein
MSEENENGKRERSSGDDEEADESLSEVAGHPPPAKTLKSVPPSSEEAEQQDGTHAGAIVEGINDEVAPEESTATNAEEKEPPALEPMEAAVPSQDEVLVATSTATGNNEEPQTAEPELTVGSQDAAFCVDRSGKDVEATSDALVDAPPPLPEEVVSAATATEIPSTAPLASPHAGDPRLYAALLGGNGGAVDPTLQATLVNEQVVEVIREIPSLFVGKVIGKVKNWKICTVGFVVSRKDGIVLGTHRLYSSYNTYLY